MINHSSFFLFFFACALSLAVATATSRFVDFLYRRNAALLQDVPAQVPRLRRPFLALAFLLCWELLSAKAGCPALLPAATFPASEAAPSGWMLFLFPIPGVFLLLVVTVTDAEQRLILDDTTRPLAVLGLAQSVVVSCTSANHTPLLENLSAAAVGGLAFLILAYLTRGGIGGGDVKLVAALGLWLGPHRLLTVVFAGLFLGGLTALFLLLTKRKKRKDAFAYGPCFALPAIAALLAGLP